MRSPPTLPPPKIWNVHLVPLFALEAVKMFLLRDRLLFPPSGGRGIAIVKKNCLHEKNC